jgi:plasmid stabilization system protein ParE
VTRELIVSPEAEADIAEARDWYDERALGLGMDLVLAVRATISAIVQNPFQYQIVWKRYRRARIARFPYGLIYAVSDKDITVVSCFHDRRNPKIWKRRS